MGVRLRKDELWRVNNATNNRIRETIDYLKGECLSGLIADCGEPNPLKESIINELGLCVVSINWDFNEYYSFGNYDAIFAFEVLEHIFNPLVFLNSLKDSLKDDGVVYISTPYQRPQIIKAIHHYHEIPTDRLMWLFDEAGLRVENCQRITIAGNWYNHIYGIRPMLRYFQKTRLFKLKKIIFA